MTFGLIPWFVVALVPLLLLFRSVQRRFRYTSRELARISGVSRSPLYSHFGRILSVRETLRAFGGRVQRSFVGVGEALLEQNGKVFMLERLMQSWISTTLNTVAVAFGALVAVVAVLMRGSIDSAICALAIVYCNQLTGLISFTIKTFCELENAMTSTERLRHFIAIPAEGGQAAHRGSQKGAVVAASAVEVALAREGGASGAAAWPHAGRIRIQNLRMRYRPELPLALRGIDLDIRAGEKVGVVGRSGAGKSSLIAAIFRLFEPEPGSVVEIDGINVGLAAGFPLQKLRASLAVIPQDAVIFSGTIRSNLDPFDRYGDAGVWRALEQVQLAATCRGLPSQLLFHVREGGHNLSHGQRQLLCIARALLHGSKVLFCDEATSLVDGETDALVQDIFRTHFGHCTRITIAHRIGTILDSDRVLVVDGGKVGEFDAPGVLMKTEGSMFAQMVGGKLGSGSGDGGGSSKAPVAIGEE